uniref:Uncharacterized protein n=1 Tax=Amphimedon queenslandica TaxID=400682 RepID=A0A1X7UUH8_AMPQE
MENALEGRNRLIAETAKKGCSVKEIQRLLVDLIGVYLGNTVVYMTSVRQIQRVLKHYGLCKKPWQESASSTIKRAIQNELKGPGSLVGYRGMWHYLKHSYQQTILHDEYNTVIKLMQSLDPFGTTQHKSRRLKRRVYRNKRWKTYKDALDL